MDRYPSSVHNDTKVMAGYESRTAIISMEMSSAKSVLAGLAVGIVAYVFATYAGTIFRRGDTGASIGDSMVTESLAPSAKLVAQGAKSPVTMLAQGAKPLSPTLSPSVTTLSPVIPRVNTSVPTAAPSPTAIPTPSSTPVAPRVQTPTPTPTPVPSPILTPSPAPSASSLVVINEVAWAGTAANASDEWIELYNAGDTTVDLSGWALYEGITRIIALSGIIAPGAYYLVERTDDSTVSDISADLTGSFSGSGLGNGGESLSLHDSSGASVDLVSCGSGWFNSADGPQKKTMERISAHGGGSDVANWQSNTGLITTGNDALGHPLLGTPKFKNSVSS